ncbi:MAG: diacylglycerol kinase family lipid kinase [Chloroflexi bacterium]|nr:diacylglycerol kinase family lipid kinase [Chloroflexota bacterium]
MLSPEAPFFIVNPASGGGRTARRWPALARAIREAGIVPDAVFTEARGEGAALAADAMRDGRTTLVAVGGDGTVNEVATAILANGAGGTVRIGTIGMGTGKDVAKCLGIGRPRQAIRAIAAGHERIIDAGMVRSVTRGGDFDEVHYFLLEVSAGWIPGISHSVPRWLKRLGDTVPYLIMTGVKMAGPMSRDFALTIDGDAYDGRYNSISVHNMEMWGGDLVAAPGALPDDGLLDVIRWGDLGRGAVLRAVDGQRKGGIHLRMDGIDHHPASVVELSSDRPSELDIDGEPGGWLPARIEILPRALRFLAP